MKCRAAKQKRADGSDIINAVSSVSYVLCSARKRQKSPSKPCPFRVPRRAGWVRLEGVPFDPERYSVVKELGGEACARDAAGGGRLRISPPDAYYARSVSLFAKWSIFLLGQWLAELGAWRRQPHSQGPSGFLLPARGQRMLKAAGPRSLFRSLPRPTAPLSGFPRSREVQGGEGTGAEGAGARRSSHSTYSALKAGPSGARSSRASQGAAGPGG